MRILSKRVVSTVRKDWFISSCIYLVALLLTITDAKIQADRLREYESYLQVIGGATTFNSGLVGSSLLAVWLPAQIHLLTGFDATWVFKVFPCLLFSLMPAFVYLLSRRYLNRWDSLLAAGLILSSFYFAYNPSMGRVGIAWGILAVLMWSVVGRHWRTAILFSSLLVLAHYGTVYLTMFTVGFTLLLLLVLRLKDKVDLKVVGITFVALLVGVTAWFNLAAPYARNNVYLFIEQSVTGESGTLTTPAFVEALPEEEQQVLVEEFKESTRLQNFMRLESREQAVQAAFGKTLPYMNAPQKVEFALSWIVVITLTGGLFYSYRRKILTPSHQWLAVAFYLAAVVTTIIPHMSMFYGAVRVYFTGLSVLATCFVIGVNRFSSIIRMPKYILSTGIVIFYGLSVSGILHSWFGIGK